MKSNSTIITVWVFVSVLSAVVFAQAPATVNWKHLSSMTGDIPKPDLGRQVATLIMDIDKDSVNDFVILSYEKMAWFRRSKDGWTRYVVDDGAPGVRMEAGGDCLDIDGDSDLDILEGAQSKAGEIWWWENPCPNFSPTTPWKRHQVIAVGGTHHDQIFGDINGDGNLDIYAGEMHTPGSRDKCRHWVFYGDGKGNFSTQLLSTGIGSHESKIGDLDGDGDVDILQKDFQNEQRVDVWLNEGISAKKQE